MFLSKGKMRGEGGSEGECVFSCLHLEGERENGRERELGEERKKQCGRLRTDDDNSQCVQNFCEWSHVLEDMILIECYMVLLS